MCRTSNYKIWARIYLVYIIGGSILDDDTKDISTRKDIKGKEKLKSPPKTKPERATKYLIKQTGYYFNRLIHKKNVMVAIGIISIILLSVGTLAMIYTQDHQRILEGVTVSGQNVGNLTQQEAKSVLDKEVSKLLDQTVKLNVGEQSPEVKLNDLGLILNEDLALQEAYDLGRTGSIFKKVVEKRSTKQGLNIDFTQEWDQSKLEKNLKGTLEKFNNPATDATFQVSKDNTMTIQKEHGGLIIDSDALIMKVKEINIYQVLPEIKVDLKEQKPLITAAQLEDQKITGLISTFTTNFNTSETARSENVRLAANALDMAIIKPGEILSFNKIVGERTIEGGYKDAYIIVNGQFVPGLAGGICQVSSTLYNTGLLANLAIAQRSNHDLAITYVPLGQDATVAYPDLDLKFNNNSGGYLLVRTRTTNNTLTVEFYGKVKPGQAVTIGNTIDSIVPATEQRLVDETMAHGASVLKQKGQPGYVVSSVRTVKINGAVVKTDQLGKSRYTALPKVYSVGP